MARARLVSISSLIASVALLTACASADPKQGLAEVAGFTARIEAVRQSSELAKQRVDAAVKALQAIVRFDFTGDGAAVYADFIATVDASAQQSNQLRASIEEMKREAVPLFKRWAENLDRFTSDQMRVHSQERQAATRERFDAIVTAAETAQVGCDAFNKTLNDHVAYLRYDFNVASIAVIEGEVAALAQCAATLSSHFTTCEKTARTYIEAASLPRSTAATEKDGSNEPAKDATGEAAKDAERSGG